MKTLAYLAAGIAALSSFSNANDIKYIRKSLPDLLKSTAHYVKSSTSAPADEYEGCDIETNGSMTTSISSYSAASDKYFSSFYINHHKKEFAYVLNCIVECSTISANKIQGDDAFKNYILLTRRAKLESEKAQVRGKFSKGKLFLREMRVYRKKFLFK